MLYDHMYVHLQFNYEDIEEAEEAKKEVAEMVKNQLAEVKDVRLYRKKNQVRLGIPYYGMSEVFGNLESLTSEAAQTLLNKIEAIIDGLPGCADFEASLYWHVADIDEEDDE